MKRIPNSDGRKRRGGEEWQRAGVGCVNPNPTPSLSSRLAHPPVTRRGLGGQYFRTDAHFHCKCSHRPQMGKISQQIILASSQHIPTQPNILNLTCAPKHCYEAKFTQPSSRLRKRIDIKDRINTSSSFGFQTMYVLILHEATQL